MKHKWFNRMIARKEKPATEVEQSRGVPFEQLSTCPVCGSAVVDEKTCSQCGAGLDYYRNPPAQTSEGAESEESGHMQETDPASEL